MTHTCSCGHDLGDHQTYFGSCLAMLPGSFETHYRYCPCGGFERDNQEAV